MGYWLLTCPPDGLSLTSNRFSSFVIRFFSCAHEKNFLCARGNFSFVLPMQRYDMKGAVCK